MQRYKYLALPFVGSTREKDKDPAATLAKQLNDVINKAVAKGWDFYRVDHVSILVKHGCLTALAGKPFTVQPYDMIIFRRPAE